MAKGIHKGSEFKNISETWEQNERASGGSDREQESASDNHDLARVIKEEAAEYDNVSKEERILSGDRATVNDDDAK